ncbi:family 1 encapsulin nanocompartment shell protein [Rhodococcus antarcticus]|uniref:Type 1 encapsulin shell protein n=1 Tax=Rhodococcus antarcticus TaxID=2987751 RepID=A0ABY6NYG3_9NOCA|nr:family 1 encapsulin nanocompartment shell protein [Rhodococcus antarcticus]UZJ24289.1 family 1 encapsulin nanocompartment shell protein [Rhodococcus antarcticus]
MTNADDHLLRKHAPIPTRAWKEIDDEARDRLTPLLAARTVVDWVGEGGWRRDSAGLGRTSAITALPAGITHAEATAPGVELRQRRVQPLVEVRVPFTVSRREIDDVQRGALDADLDDVERAASAIAEIENRAVFHGWEAAGITGITGAAAAPATELGTDCAAYPATVARAVDNLRRRGIEGPYALAIGPEGYTRIVETTEHGGFPLLEHLTRILGGPVVWAPGVDGAVVLSQRGGDFLLDVGQDLSVGYSHHDADVVHLYLEESFTFRVVGDDAAVVLG